MGGFFRAFSTENFPMPLAPDRQGILVPRLQGLSAGPRKARLSMGYGCEARLSMGYAWWGPGFYIPNSPVWCWGTIKNPCWCFITRRERL